MVVSNLLAAQSLTVGKSGARSLTVRPGDGALLQLRLPSGGTPTALPDRGEQDLATAIVPLNRKGRIDNVLLGQTLTLSLNVATESEVAPGWTRTQFLHPRRHAGRTAAGEPPTTNRLPRAP
jgi:hypothetical protein